MYCNMYYILSVYRLPTQRRAQILSMMVEGVSLRAISRLTGTGKNTLARLLAEFGGITDHIWSVEEVCRLAHTRQILAEK